MGKYKRYFWVLVILTIMLGSVSSCSFKHEPWKRYSQYSSDPDLDKYEKGIKGLVDLMLHNWDSTAQWKAAAELKKFNSNKSPGAREILLQYGVPGLIEGLKIDHSFLQWNIVLTLREIKPPAEVVLPAYERVILQGYSIPTCPALIAISEYGYEAKEYVPLVIDQLNSESHSVVWDAIYALRTFGGLASAGLPKLEELAESRAHPYFLEFVNEAIDAIKTDLARSPPIQ